MDKLNCRRAALLASIMFSTLLPEARDDEEKMMIEQAMTALDGIIENLDGKPFPAKAKSCIDFYDIHDAVIAGLDLTVTLHEAH